MLIKFVRNYFGPDRVLYRAGVWYDLPEKFFAEEEVTNPTSKKKEMRYKYLPNRRKAFELKEAAPPVAEADTPEKPDRDETKRLLDAGQAGSAQANVINL